MCNPFDSTECLALARDYYSILGVTPTAEDVVIKAAYKALAQRYHPDRFGGDPDFAKTRMEELNEAFQVLSDPVRRQAYYRAVSGTTGGHDRQFEEWIQAFVDNWEHGD